MRFIEMLRYINLVLSGVATITTGHLLTNWLLGSIRFPNKRRASYILLTTTFILFFGFVLFGVMIYMSSIFEIGISTPPVLARYRTFIATIAVIVLSVYYRLESVKA